MKNKLQIVSLIFICIVIFSFKIINDDPKKYNDASYLPYQIATIDSKKMDGNNISTWYRNNGSFNRDPSTGNSGFEWPKGARKFA